MLPDRDLERELRELGSRVEYPPTPDLASAVRSRLDEEGGSAPTRGWFDLPVARWAAVAAVVLIAAVPVLSPAARDTVAGWFEGGQASGGGEALSGGEAAGGPEDATVMMEEDAESRADVPQSAGGPDMPASGGETPSSARGPGFGERMPLREAETRLGGRELLLPEARGLGEPDEIYANGPSRSGGVVLVYDAGSGPPSEGDAGIGLVLTEVPGTLESAYRRGGDLADAPTGEVSVGDGRGYWAPSGGRHLPNALFWERGGLALRLEADLPKREMTGIAESVR
jgi:hypothetical protein